MDPLAQAMQLLAEAQQTIQMLAEEVQIARQQTAGNGAPKQQDKGKDLSKTASVNELSEIFGVNAGRLPDFIKEASANEARSFYHMIEENIRFSSFGKVAEFQDGNSFSDPAEALESRLSSLLS